MQEQPNRKYLEHQYSPSRWSKLHGPEDVIENHICIIDKASMHARKTVNNELNINYGNQAGNGQRMDLFFPSDENSKFLSKLPDFAGTPILLFVHGGYWQFLSKDSYAYMGDVFSKFGIITAVVGYDLAPNVKVETIYSQMKHAVVYLAKRFTSSPLVISGHSAGGHLVALLLKENWVTHGLPNSPIKGVIPISGVFDLQPLVNTYVNDPLKMDIEEALRLSPMEYILEMKQNANCRVLCLIGEYESPEFHRQSREYCQALQDVGIEASLDIITKTDHFSIMHDFLNKGYKGTTLVMDMFKDLGTYDQSNKTVI